jgi:hypothetical protein
MDNIKDLYRKGLTPINITVDDKGKQSKRWFSLGDYVYDNKEVNIPLLKILWRVNYPKVMDLFSIWNIPLPKVE